MMKTKMMKTVVAFTLAVLMITATQAFAQRGRNYKSNMDRPYRNNGTCWRIPDLTADQETKIDALRVNHWKEMNNYRNQMNELRARKRTLNTSEQANLNEINSVIDQMSGMHNKMMKASAKHRKEVRNLLSDEQKVYFDSMPLRGQRFNRGANRRGGGYGNYSGAGRGYGYGNGYGDGYGYRYSNYPINEE
ncbi:MAG TPA: Spy/CpxP family protein refolding chaperone [Bacteroidales bacterium]|nr:Spy/CpxP family protein refolding chaperone [Bacteroidales bacterium]